MALQDLVSVVATIYRGRKQVLLTRPSIQHILPAAAGRGIQEAAGYALLRNSRSGSQQQLTCSETTIPIRRCETLKKLVPIRYYSSGFPFQE